MQNRSPSRSQSSSPPKLPQIAGVIPNNIWTSAGYRVLLDRIVHAENVMRTGAGIPMTVKNRQEFRKFAAYQITLGSVPAGNA